MRHGRATILANGIEPNAPAPLCSPHPPHAARARVSMQPRGRPQQGAASSSSSSSGGQPTRGGGRPHSTPNAPVRARRRPALAASLLPIAQPQLPQVSRSRAAPTLFSSSQPTLVSIHGSSGDGRMSIERISGANGIDGQEQEQMQQQAHSANAPTGGGHSTATRDDMHSAPPPMSPLVLPPLHPSHRTGQAPAAHPLLGRSHSLTSLSAQRQQQQGTSIMQSMQQQQQQQQQHPQRQPPPIQLPPRPAAAPPSDPSDCAMLPSASEEMLDAVSSATPSGSSPLRRSGGCSDLQQLMATRSVLLWEGLPEARVASVREEHRQQPTTVTQRAPYAASFEWCIPNFPAFLPSSRSNAPSSPASVAASASATLPSAPSPTMLSSPTFVSHGQAWHLIAFPDGVNDGASGFLSVFMRRLPPPVGGNGDVHAPTNKIVVASEPHPPTVPVAAPSTAPVPIAPPPPSSALLSSGLMFVRPHFRLTLIHPSGDARCNLVIDSEGIEMNFLHAAYPQQQLADSPPSTFGLARFLHHSVILQQFLDAHGNILLRVEMIELRRYVWSMPTGGCVPPIPMHVFATLPQPAQRVPTLVPSITRAAHARNASFSSSPSSAFASTSSSSSSSRGPRTGPVIRQTSSHSSHSSLSLHSLTSFFSPSRSAQSAAQSHANALQLQQQQINQLMNHASYNTRSSVTSSHLMFHSYEFFLRLDSVHAVAPLIPAARIEEISVVLALHPRHFYRLNPELSIKLEVEMTVAPAQQIAPMQPSHHSWMQRVPQRSTFLTQLHSGGSRTAEICWAEAGSSLAKALKDAGAADPFAPVSLASYSSLHVSVDFLSLGLVWTVPQFSSLSSARKVSGMFRLKDFTWNIIMDPRGNGEPGHLSMYLALDKTSAAIACHGLALAPVFTLSILHPTDPSQHLCRRFEDAMFTFDRASWGCTLFCGLTQLSEGGWLGADSTLQVEVQIQSVRLVRPEDLRVDTKIGHDRRTRAEQMQHEADMREAAMAHEQHNSEQAHHPGSGGGGGAAKVIFTPSSPALGPANGPAAPPSTPQPLSGNERVTIHRRSSSFRSSSSINSVSPESPALNRSVSPPQQQQQQQFASASSSPPLTPMVEYLGQDMENEECDSYALAVQTRRFGGQVAAYAPMFHPDASLAPPLPTAPRPSADGRSNPSFLYSPPLSFPSDSASPSPQPLPASSHSSSHSYTPLQPHLLTSTTRHGYVCIIRNSHFTDPKLPQLIGYEVDEDRLLSTFLHALHCDVETHINISGSELLRVFSELSRSDFSAYDYLLVFILTHGVDSNTVYAADGAHLAVADLFSMFKGVCCRTLAGKPKLFFVQACRGNNVDYSAKEGSGIPNLTPPQPAATNGSATTQQQQQQPQHSQPQQPPPPPAAAAPPVPPVILKTPALNAALSFGCDTPNEADFLYASSCVPGYISWTNTASGSWYITALCNVLLSYWPTMHLGDILLRVNYAVSRQNKLVDRYGSVYQIAAPAFTLTKRLFFVSQQRQISVQRHRAQINSASASSSAAAAMDASSEPASAEVDDEKPLQTPRHLRNHSM